MTFPKPQTVENAMKSFTRFAGMATRRVLYNGDDPNTAWEKAKGQYGRVDDAVKIIDPRKE